MMGSSSEEEDGFFDTREDITSVSDSCPDGPENFDISLRAGDFIPAGVGFQVWVKEPESIHERRKRFLKWMGACAEEKQEDYQDTNCDEMEVETETIMKNTGAFLRNSGFDDGYSSSQSPMSYCSNEALELLDVALEENFSCRINILGDCTEFIVDELRQVGFLRRLREVGTNRLIPVEQFERTLGLSPLIQQVVPREVQGFRNSEKLQVKRGWLRRLGTLACIVDRKVAGNLKSCDSHPIIGARTEKVRVKAYKKRSKELSALYVGQDILAHKGSILTMKFSPDGKYLASAGEDRIVRVWQVTESGRSNEFHVPEFDPSFVYFTGNHLSELVPLYEPKEKMGRLWSLRKTSDPTCVIFPRKVFSISKKPLHEFQGHRGDVLDLSWSKNELLLSSSADYSVRLWQVGSDRCLKVFSHNNYVSSVEFNPVNDNYFISGSIDGKVRIWAIPGCQVVDWTDVREIVTAVCYSPDGKGGIVGSTSGNCYFYDASDNRLQLYAQICLQGKKKPPFNRITGFQFSPADPTKLMVSSADSQVRILHGIDVIGQVRAVRNSGSQIPASDGIHLISASEDSNIYMWNYISKDESSQIRSKWPCERFFSNNVTVAIPWCGMTCGNSILSDVIVTSSSSLTRTVNQPRCGSENESSADFSSSRGLFSDSLSKGFATWPEENLPAPSPLAVASASCKSQYKFLKMSCQKAFGSPHAWGLVIVTGSLDGRIRSFQNYGLPTLI